MKSQMQLGINAYKEELLGMRTGRAHPGLLERITVDYYGSQTPLKQMANIVATDSKTLTITPWDKQALEMIAKAIQVSDLGLNPMMAADLIRISIPPLTEERRKDLVKHLKAQAEHSKVGIRNLRRSALNELKAELKEKLITEDDERRDASKIQKITDDFIDQIDQMTTQKEKELMTV